MIGKNNAPHQPRQLLRLLKVWAMHFVGELRWGIRLAAFLRTNKENERLGEVSQEILGFLKWMLNNWSLMNDLSNGLAKHIGWLIDSTIRMNASRISHSVFVVRSERKLRIILSICETVLIRLMDTKLITFSNKGRNYIFKWVNIWIASNFRLAQTRPIPTDGWMTEGRVKNRRIWKMHLIIDSFLDVVSS